MVGKLIFVCCLLVFVFQSTLAQVDYNKQYFNAKALFREGKYNLAMESFKPLIPYDPKNNFSQYSSFYYALAAYNQGFKAVAKNTLNQLKTTHPTWNKMDDVNFWIGKIHLDDRDYFQALKIFSTIQDKKIQQDIDATKRAALAPITDVETLKMMYEEYPKDPVIARSLATLLAKDISIPEDKVLLESLITKFSFKKTDFIAEAPASYFKDVYSVSVLLPFMVNTLDPSPAPKRNQSVLDLYEGMKQAIDTLDKQGVKLSLRAYDTEWKMEKIKSILNTDELKNTDLVLGPFFQDEAKLIQEFSLANRVNTFNPVHNNSELIGTNPYGFLYQPSVETLGRKSGEFLASYAKKKNCMVFYGTSKRDSLLASNFVQAAHKNKLKIVAAHKVPKDGSKLIFDILTTATEYDEFRNPIQFTLPKDSLGSIFVASDDALIYAKVVSSMETRRDQIIALGSERWINQTSIDLEKFQTLPIVLSAPNFNNPQKPATVAFEKKYIRTHGKPPSDYAAMGYELMLILGNQLKKNGVYFQEAMAKAPVNGYLTEGVNYQESRSNSLIPFIKFTDGNMVVVEKR
jgi:ABC-type branched-subunit amino acid transport system substrate-binding protein